MELGDSVDVSRCQAKKNDGSGCTNLVSYIYIIDQAI